MKKHIISTLCVSLLLAASYAQAQEPGKPALQLTQVIDDALFSPTSALKLTHQEISMLTNALLLLYMESHFILRSHIAPVTEELERRKEVIEKTRIACSEYIKTHGSESLQAAMNLLQHNTQSLKRSYLNKYQEELISGERDTFVHAQALQQVTVNLYGIWYKTLFEGMKRNNFEASCFKFSFNIEGLVPEEARKQDMPAPNSLMQ